MGWLKNEVILITGGGSGLGLALVERFIDEGARIAVLQRSVAKVAALKQRYADDIVVIEGDVAKYQDNLRAVQATVERFGKLDCFIGNAGIWDHYADIVNMTGEQLDQAFDEIMGINSKALILGAKAALNELLKSEGSIIFTLSNSALYPAGGGPVYTASKHAGVGIMKELAYELAPKIRVNAVAPSGMNVNIKGAASLGQENIGLLDARDPEKIARGMPLDFLPEAEDMTGAYVLLASRQNNRPLTGVLINADCGLGIRGLRQPRAELLNN
ncbi:3-(cis-5,6-dihydroxycyclohexa-1,3-dien-1-yl)propanoate dehydrogenase [Acinetobacter qingfengensis]|uniref:3-(Cis-5,6-dihydroxycyclohexa-1, 3-dien-1-yl)propanoate dehydrogenase n=1 Tax=Acinetobacter qingfengensis TaxID=1262585 RepID=A0A1E7R3M2_9GAMM|nr:3-phenylpropionate-dihydrodiol/cinnamic acid-dihydrodiol dehydrogenase [Acinetobacter qingfengensis]KAA8731491.1 3-(cis-5,6-dihydroxycyclohexa-1,3-dien-1-yl)propanoate dehydrogenase [Acinetobacter qingfengensis]OEY93969.1 3-(cis-5,6-dihydroxycyclohexa-1,3-dien-1-yl)propanoate dehydrogenase [Acinetobacter qingfengensis]